MSSHSITQIRSPEDDSSVDPPWDERDRRAFRRRVPDVRRIVAHGLVLGGSAAVAGFVPGLGPHGFAILFAANLLAFSVMRAWGGLREDELFVFSQGVQVLLLGAILTVAASLVFETFVALPRSVILLALGGSVVILAVISASSRRAPPPVRTPRIPPIDPDVVSFLTGRTVVILGTDRGVLAAILPYLRTSQVARIVALCADETEEQAIFESGTDAENLVAIRGNPHDPACVRTLMNTFRPSVVLMVDGDAPRTLDGSSALATRCVAVEALRAGVEVLIRVGRDQVSADDRLSDRVIRALAGLSRTRLIRLRVPASRAEDHTAKTILRLAVAGGDGVFLRQDSEGRITPVSLFVEEGDSQALWGKLDMLEGRGERERLTDS